MFQIFLTTHLFVFLFLGCKSIPKSQLATSEQQNPTILILKIQKQEAGRNDPIVFTSNFFREKLTACGYQVEVGEVRSEAELKENLYQSQRSSTTPIVVVAHGDSIVGSDRMRRPFLLDKDGSSISGSTFLNILSQYDADASVFMSTCQSEGCFGDKCAEHYDLPFAGATRYNEDAYVDTDALKIDPPSSMLAEILCDARDGGKLFFSSAKQDQRGKYIDGDKIRRFFIERFGTGSLSDGGSGTEEKFLQAKAACEDLSRKGEKVSFKYTVWRNSKTKVSLNCQVKDAPVELLIREQEEISDAYPGLTPKAAYEVLHKILVKEEHSSLSIF